MVGSKGMQGIDILIPVSAASILHFQVSNMSFNFVIELIFFNLSLLHSSFLFHPVVSSYKLVYYL